VSVTDTEAMVRAVALAYRGWGRTAPNPMVGAVLLRDGEVIGEGWHADFGGPHAEVAALAAAGDARGATCVVTLEPCAHHGKTPPCVDALLEAGVSRVVVAVRDPHPVARGGVERLRAAGVDVSVGIGREEAATLNAPFLWGTVRPARPFVAVKVATSLDGFIADAAGRSRWISGPDARAYVHWLRAGYDAIGVGRRTAEHDDPELTVRGEVVPRRTPTRVIFAATGPIEPRLTVVRTARSVPTVVVAPTERASAYERELAPCGVRTIAADDFDASLRALRAEGIESLLIEGGGTLVGHLLDADLVDRLYWIQAPLRLGRGVAAFGASRAVQLGEAPRWTIVERRALGDDTLLVADRELCLPEL